MHPENKEKLEKRVIQAAWAALEEQKHFSAIDIFLRMGWLMPSSVKDWRLGKVDYLERRIQANLKKISYVMKFLKKWALERGLKPSQTVYLMRTKGFRQKLQFSKRGELNIETAYRTHYVSPELSEKKQAKLQGKLDRPPESVVFQIRRDSECSQCKAELGSGSFLFMEQERPLCMTCSGFNDFIYLPAGDAKRSRLAKSYSSRYAVIVQFSRTRKRYERQGLLVERQALERAGKETGVDFLASTPATLLMQNQLG